MQSQKTVVEIKSENQSANFINPSRSKRATFDKIAEVNGNTKSKFYNILNENHHGRLVIIGDSNCIDSTFTQKYCLWLLKAFLEYTMNSYISPFFERLNSISYYRNNIQKTYPARLNSSRLDRFSKVVKNKNIDGKKCVL